MATPPLAVPSSLVRMMPLISTASLNILAWFRPFWPVVASIISMQRTVASLYSRSMMRRILDSSSIRFFLLCRRPAVSIISRSALRALAACTASNTTAAGSLPI